MDAIPLAIEPWLLPIHFQIEEVQMEKQKQEFEAAQAKANQGAR